MLALMCCLAACTFDPAVANSSANDDTTAATEAATTGNVSAGPGPADGSRTGSASASAGDATDVSGPVSTDATSPSEDTRGSDADTGATTGGDDTLMGDDAVLVRYLLDEQASGALGLDVQDVGPAPAMDLAPFYSDGAGQPYYVEVDGHRGLRWDDHGQSGRAQTAVAGTKLHSLDGTTAVSFEFVLEVTSVFPTTEPFARLLVWQPDIVPYELDMGVLTSLGAGDEFAIDFRGSWQPGGGLPMARWSMAGYTGRVVVHMVIDTLAADPMRVFIDGDEIVAEILNLPAPGETIVVREEGFLVLGNRPANNVSFGGTVYYAAIYDRALTMPEVAHNATRLIVDDDAR